MIKNYFSDITDLFLKVKNEENIRIDETAKAQIRSMLVSKIAAMKSPEASETEDSNPSFWSTWKYQLFGIPASVFALVLITFAASNLKISMPKEDFSPTKTPTITPTITEEKPTEKDRPIVKTAPKLLVIDYSERSLNPINSPRPRWQQDSSTNLEVQIETPILETATTTKVTNKVDTGEEKKEETKKISEPAPITNVQLADLDAEITVEPAIETTTEAVTVDIIEAADETVIEEVVEETPIQTIEIVEKIPAITSKLSVPVYTYKDEELKENESFSQEKLLKLTSSETPESVTVYYADKNKVVVEIEENGITKWYLFDNINGTWTISRYEKYDTKAVVK